MGGDDPKRLRDTKRFTRAELAELADKARGPQVEEPVAGEPVESPRMSRAQTVDDPMTTQLLAEVARRLETMAPDDPGTDTAHPNLLRRRQT